MKILIVEDEPSLRELIQYLIGHHATGRKRT